MVKIRKIIKTYEDIPLNYKLGFIYTFIFGLLVHLYMMTNKLPNHDDIHQLFFNMDLRISGRWFLQYAGLISSYFSMPWVNGLLLLTYISISAALIVGLFNINSKLLIILISGIMVSFTGVVSVFVYMNSADAYFLALLMSVLGSYLYIRLKKGYIFFVILNILSLATYQIYLGISISIIFIYYILDYIDNNTETKELIKRILFLVFMSILVLALYMVSVKYIFVVELTSYQDLDKMGQINFKDLPNLVLSTYKAIYNFFIKDNFSQFGLIKYLNIIFFAISGVLSLNFVISRLKDNKKRIIAIFLILLLPISINMIFILTNGAYVGLRMLYAYILIYIFVILLIYKLIYNNESRLIINSNILKILVSLIIIIYAISIYRFSIVTNKVYLALDIDQRNLQAYTNRIINKIEDQDGYTKDKEIVYIGYPNITNEFTKEYFTDDIKATTLLRNKIPSTIHWNMYHERYMAFPNKIIRYDSNDVNRIEDIKLKEMIENADKYPNKNSIFEYNNRIYVKFN